MAHKLANGNYRHRHILIKRCEYPQSSGAAFGVEWKTMRETFNTLAEAVAHVDAVLNEEESRNR